MIAVERSSDIFHVILVKWILETEMKRNSEGFLDHS